MIHNGIEYGMLQAYGEGFELLQASQFDLDLGKIAHLWNQGSVVRSWLLELTESAFQKDPKLSSIRGYVEDSGEGRWTVQEAIERSIPAPVLMLSLFARFASRQQDSFSAKVIAALRTAYGLEGTLETHTPFDTISREEVLAHYRTGFGEEMAQELTNYSWLPASRQLRSTDPALAVPDSVGVVELKGDRAVVAWIAPTSFRRQWNAPRCLVDRMVLVDGRWIIQGREP